MPEVTVAHSYTYYDIIAEKNSPEEAVYINVYMTKLSLLSAPEVFNIFYNIRCSQWR